MMLTSCSALRCSEDPCLKAGEFGQAVLEMILSVSLHDQLQYYVVYSVFTYYTIAHKHPIKSILYLVKKKEIRHSFLNLVTME